MNIELLSPAGSPEALRAAVQNGTDAIYLGWGDFNARRNAKNFSDEEFAEALNYCHFYGVKVFLTMNTLLTDRELTQALELATTACNLGIDAILVQDWGLFTLLKSTLPDVPLHASTQMSLFTSGGACEASAMGMERVVIARECSREDTRSICQNCDTEVETFVHGALCMCYSGQCSMSAAVGGRSGNRGTCAQPCRLPYGVNKRSTDDEYPLSLKDSALAPYLDELSDMGVACVKLEGRMKRPEYVALVTGIYATLLRENRKPTPDEQETLEMAFSRDGFTDEYWNGRHSRAMFGTRSEHTPVPKDLFAMARTTYEKDSSRQIPVYFSMEMFPKQPISLTAWDDEGNTTTVIGDVPEAARNRAITMDDLCQRLAKTGGSGFVCVEAVAHVGENLSLSASSINGLRRDALAQLRALRTEFPVRRVETPSQEPTHKEVDGLGFTVSVRTLAQASTALLELNPARVYVPLEILAQADALPTYSGQWCAILPRVWRDYDEHLLKEWIAHAKSLGVTGLLLGNLGHFSLCHDFDMELYGDYGLNVFNSRSLAFLQEKGLSSATLSFELRGVQIRDMVKPMDTEALIYGRLPLMITENCIMKNARLGHCDPASVHCTRDEGATLNDRFDASFPILPAFGHRSEIQNSKVLYLGDRSDYKEMGLAYGRLRFTTESPLECAALLQAYQNADPAPKNFTRGLFDRGVE